jgi:hypothetical protein
MQFTDILSFCFSILGLYGLVYYLRFLIPRNLLPYVSAVLTGAEHLFDRAESTGVIPQPNDHRSALTSYEAVVFLPTDRCRLTDQHSCANEFLRIRMESHHAPELLQQLQYGLTRQLYALSSRVVAIKVETKICQTFLFIPTINEGVLAGHGRATAHVAYRQTKRYCSGTAYLSGKYASNI